jgi:hypothetical protein
MRRRRYVKVFRVPAQKQISNAAADQIGFVPALPQPIDHLERVGVQLLGRNLWGKWRVGIHL